MFGRWTQTRQKHIYWVHSSMSTLLTGRRRRKKQNLHIRIRIFIIPINGPTIGANKLLHTLIIVIGGNYTYIYIYLYTSEN